MMNANNYKSFPSCSQRRFWELDENGYTAVESHHAFVNHLKDGNSLFPIKRKIGFKGVPSQQFYFSYVNKLKEASMAGIVEDKYGLLERKLEIEETNHGRHNLLNIRP